MEITHLHVEASTHCNARCPGCPRSIRGYSPEGFLNLTHLTPEKFMTVRKKYEALMTVNFNGNLGDPMMNPRISELIEIADCDVAVTTNGSIGNRKTFERLAVDGVHINFSIDGLEDTNHLYRQDVEWDKIVQRIGWFISAGGEATWKWVPFRHNFHQLEETKEFARSVGITNFFVDDQARNHFPALDKEGKVSHWILPHDTDDQPNPEYEPTKEIAMMQQDATFDPVQEKQNITCEHLRDASVYVSADGFESPCCYHGLDLVNRKRKSLKEFGKLKFGWDYKICDPVCAQFCGNKSK